MEPRPPERLTAGDGVGQAQRRVVLQQHAYGRRMAAAEQRPIEIGEGPAGDGDRQRGRPADAARVGVGAVREQELRRWSGRDRRRPWRAA